MTDEQYAVYCREKPMTVVKSEDVARKICGDLGTFSRYEPVSIAQAAMIRLDIRNDIVEENSAIRIALSK